MRGTFLVRYRAEGMICNERRSLPMPTGGAVRPPAGPGQSPGLGPGSEVPGSSYNTAFCTTLNRLKNYPGGAYF